MKPRPLDHLVIGTHDLDGLGARFAALGFTVGARNRHPWGTENRIIQFGDETFLELITVADPSLILAHAPNHFSFGAFVRAALDRRAGLSMLVMKGNDAREDATGFAKAGIGDFSPFDFSRKGIRADGSETEVAFSLAFARDIAMPEAGFFTCQHHFPTNFWSKPAQTHANGALGISRVSLIAENPSDHHIFLSAFTGERTMRATSTGIEVALGGTSIEILTGQGHAMRYGGPVPPEAPARLAGFEIRLPAGSTLPDLAKMAGISLNSCSYGPALRASVDLETDILFNEEHEP